jgi:hypothetical protein
MVLNCCETWSLILREEHRLTVIEKSVLTRIFGPRREEESRGWTNCIIRSFLIRRQNCQVKDDEWAGHVGQMGAERNAHRTLAEKARRKETI